MRISPISGQMIELLVEPAAEVDLTQPSQASDREGKLSAQLLAKTTGTKKLSVKIGQQVLADVAAMIFQPGPADKIQLSTEKNTVKPGQTAIIKVEVKDQ